MNYQLRTPQDYSEKLGKFLKKHPDLIEGYYKTIKLLQLNPYHPSLRLHKLHGNKNGLQSISINMKYRITIDFIIEDKRIILIDITKHYS